MKVLNNVQIIIENVHFRYEDTEANKDHPFAVGFLLKGPFSFLSSFQILELNMHSTNENWKKQFTTVVGDAIMYKVFWTLSFIF